MRILHVTDFHFHKPWFAWAKRAAAQYDAVAITGDLIDAASLTPAAEQVRWLTKWARNCPGRLLICRGNHDEQFAGLSPHLQNWLHKMSSPFVTTDGTRVKIGKWNFECVGWGDVPQFGGPDCVALVHCPPSEARTAKAGPFWVDLGDFELGENLRTGINAPWLVLSGHIHWSRNFADRVGESWSLNPGRGPVGFPPNHIVIDLEKSVARWVKHDEREFAISLERPLFAR